MFEFQNFFQRETGERIGGLSISSPLPVLQDARTDMPALVQGGPKLPSFQKLKSKKRASPQAAEELENAPKSKKPAPLTKTATPASEGGVEKKEKPRKAQKKNEWNNRMAAERRERLEKKEKGTKTSSESAPAARTKAAPGSNWQQLKVRENLIQRKRQPRSTREARKTDVK